jgi:transcriptional regulator of acetoin/glycerol metabolism
MTTCDTCFDGRHYRCENKGECSCTVCAARWSKPRKTNSKQEEEKQALERDRAAKALPARRPQIKSRKHVRPPRELSMDPKKVAQREYMRQWRERKKTGEPIRTNNKYTQEKLDEMMRLREAGLTVREIAEKLELDPRATARHIRVLSGTTTEADRKRMSKALLEEAEARQA